MDWPTFKVSEHNGGKMIITAKMRALVWMKMVHSSSSYYSPSVDTSPILWPTLEIGSKSLIYSNTLFSFFFTYFHLCHHLNGYNSLMDFQILQHFSLALQYSHNDWYNCHLHISQPSRFPGKVEIFLFFFFFLFFPLLWYAVKICFTWAKGCGCHYLPFIFVIIIITQYNNQFEKWLPRCHFLSSFLYNVLIYL